MEGQYFGENAAEQAARRDERLRRLRSLVTPDGFEALQQALNEDPLLLDCLIGDDGEFGDLGGEDAHLYWEPLEGDGLASTVLDTTPGHPQGSPASVAHSAIGMESSSATGESGEQFANAPGPGWIPASEDQPGTDLLDLPISFLEALNGEKEDPILQAVHSNRLPSATPDTTTGGQQDRPATAAPARQGAEIGHRNKRARHNNTVPNRNAPQRHSLFIEARMAEIEQVFRETPDISWTDLARRLRPGLREQDPHEYSCVVQALKQSTSVSKLRPRVSEGGSVATRHDTAASSSAPARMPQQLAGVDPAVREVLVQASQLSTDQRWTLVHALLDQLRHAQQ